MWEIDVSELLSELLSRNYALPHRRAVDLALTVPDDDFGRSVAPAIHSLAYQLWHMARWADVFGWVLVRNSPALAERLRERIPVTQMWERDALAASWGLPVGRMGQRDTGTSLSDQAAEQLVLPERALVVAYAERAFDFAERVIGAIDERALLEVAPRDPDDDSYGQNILIYTEHDNRHLGMIEAIAGLLGHPGTATD